MLNFAILQGWIEANPVLAKLALVPERRDPILLPTDRDIALVMERAPGMVGQMMRAALVTGAREDELAKAKRIDIDHARRQLTIVGKRNKLRVIDLDAVRRLPVLRPPYPPMSASRSCSGMTKACPIRASRRRLTSW